MALDYRDRYPSQTVDGGADYPEGKARDVGTPGDGTGTPWQEDLVNDLWGFLQGLTGAAAIEISGVPDTAPASDRLAAIRKLTRRIGCHVDVTGGPVADDDNLLMEIVRQSEFEVGEAGFVILDSELEETTINTRLRAPEGALYYVHFSGLVTLLSSGDDPATVELRLHASDAVRVFGVRYSAAGLHPIAVSGGGLVWLSPMTDEELFIQNKSGTPVTVAFATLTVVRVGSAVGTW